LGEWKGLRLTFSVEHRGLCLPPMSLSPFPCGQRAFPFLRRGDQAPPLLRSFSTLRVFSLSLAVTQRFFQGTWVCPRFVPLLKKFSGTFPLLESPPSLTLQFQIIRAERPRAFPLSARNLSSTSAKQAPPAWFAFKSTAPPSEFRHYYDTSFLPRKEQGLLLFPPV